MAELARVTSEYVPSEDRIRLTGQITGGPIITLWISRRLLSLLLPHLFNWLDKSASKTVGVHDTSHLAVSDVVQIFAQEAAVLTLLQAEQAPVRPSETGTRSSDPGESFLVESVDIETGELGVRLVFKNSEKERLAELTMSQQALRQWLHIVYGQTLKADWSLQAWPSWLHEVNIHSVNQTKATFQ